MKNYNPSVGYLKALGILLMVLGHSGNTLHVNHFIYMFHMPLFFIASGYCFKEKYLSARGPRAHGAGRRLHCPWPFLDALLPQRHGLFTPAAAVRRAPDGHGQVRPRHFEPRHGRRGRYAAHCARHRRHRHRGRHARRRADRLVRRLGGRGAHASERRARLLSEHSHSARAREPARRRARAHDACARHRLHPKLRAYRAQRVRPRAHAELRPFGGADGRVHRAHPLCSHSAEHLAHARLRHHHRL